MSGTPRFKSLILKIFVYFDSSRRQGFNFECIQLAGHWRTRSRDPAYEREYSTLSKQKQQKARQIQTESGPNHGEDINPIPQPSYIHSWTLAGSQ